MISPNEYEDDLPEGQSRLIRRIPSPWFDVATSRILSGAFQFLDRERALRMGCPGPGLSVIVEELAPSLEDVIKRYHTEQGEGLAFVDEAILRGDGERGIHLRPTPDEPAHAVAFCVDSRTKLPKGTMKRLAEFSTENLIVAPAST